MKILMVCLGNICRSPLAHGVLQHLVDERGLGWEIDSAGTGDWHIGQAPDHRSIAVAAKYGIDISKQKAQHFNPTLFDKYDYILVMDNQNYKDVIAQTTSVTEREKVKLFIPDNAVPDPYFDAKMFDPVYKMIEKRCVELINELR
ncbi:low molecular weight phosphotyrosine protein phosphatase [Sphingobacterium spiritivorum ATCC 33300]|uniref:protein-tyrosine-phosphatase n=1 Tax=Sphingobacterium spiritivorum ATCC 33300 TaxID=525372 RepID=C2FRQ1_SPHSI|nr:low molecular weight protein-tyrosine-phosphatase [Sphingobacterium spiritivorum]EEI94266.1 low molecular weight phosphotyrosine protein phosphatase [Sphingobacterium spiritivorum ATCC 33300]QQS98133.1 low molecular weight phosphotyrosine protein phosphatase [Sphingobacterium spiritivorum]